MTLVGFLVPELVTPLGLLVLRVLGVVATNMMVELAQISVRYSLSVAAVSLAALCGVMDVSLLVRVVDFGLCTFCRREYRPTQHSVGEGTVATS